MEKPDGLSPETLCNHFPFEPLPANNQPLSPPIYQSVKFALDDFDALKEVFRGERRGYFYARHGNPTVDHLVRLLAQLQGYESGWATASGIAAVSGTLFSLLSPGDRLVYFLESYKPIRLFAERHLKRMGVQLTRVSMADTEGLAAALALEDTKVLLCEGISNPQLQAPPLEVIIPETRRRGIITVLDNTFAGFQSLGPLQADYEVHSLTKYASGHGDVMGGVVLGSAAKIKRIEATLALLGATLDAHAAYLILRGMKTYHLRRREQCKNAMALASWLEQHPKVESVIYPGLASHPQRAIFSARYQDFGSMIFLRLKNKDVNLEQLVTQGRCFRLAASLGSTESLITPALYFYGGDLKGAERQAAGLDRSALRLSIGIEALSDLEADLAQLLERVPPSKA